MKESVSSEVLDDLVQIVTHRIASLTAGVEGYADMLVDTLNTPEQRRLARHILEGVARINGVVDDLRFFIRPVEAVCVPIRAATLVGSAMDILTESEQRRITVASRDEDGLRLMADPHLSRQTLHALLRNALDAAGRKGSVRVSFAESEPSFGEIRIWNDGAQLPTGDADRALAPFFTTKAQNLGLGLTIALRMARAQGGDVRIDDVSHGTTVLFRLPRAVAQ